MKHFFKIKVVVLISSFFSIFAGVTYVKGWYGNFPEVFNLIDLNGANGFVISTTNEGDSRGYSVDGAGDINGDGINDILIGAPLAHNKIGQAYVVFGSKNPWPSEIDLGSLNGVTGFVLSGINSGDYCGGSVSGIGDVNADGRDDIIIGARNANNDAGQSYIIFGSNEPWPALIDLSRLNGVNGVIINGSLNDNSGSSVSGAGDVNGDGIADILIGAPSAINGSGKSYVVFGKKAPWTSIINLVDLDGSNGFSINGINPGDKSGSSLSGAGDVNGDGIADILIGARDAIEDAGQSYVVFGIKQLWPKSINLVDLNGINGFGLNGIHSEDESGESVSGAGDVNGDGIADILIGALGAKDNTGQSYVVFGNNQTKWPKIISFADLNGKNGFTMNGISPGDLSGSSVSGIGDINHDGIDDIIIGAPLNVDLGYAGQSYVVFGSKREWSVATYLGGLNGLNGFIINGVSSYELSGSSVNRIGDVNGDGIDDIIIGSFDADEKKSRTYIVFGCCGTSSSNDDVIIALGVGGGIAGLTAIGVGSYYVYQHYHRIGYIELQ